MGDKVCRTDQMPYSVVADLGQNYLLKPFSRVERKTDVSQMVVFPQT